jgi:hypothetical protein
MNEKTINQALAFLGKKLDEVKVAFLSKNITVDMGATTESIGKAVATPVILGLQTVVAEIEKQTRVMESKDSTEVCRELRNLQMALQHKKMEVTVNEKEVSFEPIFTAINKLAESISKNKTDNKDVVAALRDLQKTILETEHEAPEVDLVPLTAAIGKMEKALDKILTAIKENAPEKIGEKIDAMDAVFKGLKPKDSVRFDDTQMKALMSALTNPGGGFTTNPGVKSATNWEVDRVAITLANTQYSYTFPSNTVSWTFKLRTPGASLFYSDVTGKLPVSGDNSTYMTMLPMGARSQDGMEWGGKTMYFESDAATQVVELEIFTM